MIERCVTRHFASESRNRLARPDGIKRGESGTRTAPSVGTAKYASRSSIELARTVATLSPLATPRLASMLATRLMRAPNVRQSTVVSSNVTAGAEGRYRAWRWTSWSSRSNINLRLAVLARESQTAATVSYTHLTLPTSDLV